MDICTEFYRLGSYQNFKKPEFRKCSPLPWKRGLLISFHVYIRFVFLLHRVQSSFPTFLLALYRRMILAQFIRSFRKFLRVPLGMLLFVSCTNPCIIPRITDHPVRLYILLRKLCFKGMSSRFPGFYSSPWEVRLKK